MRKQLTHSKSCPPWAISILACFFFFFQSFLIPVSANVTPASSPFLGWKSVSSSAKMELQFWPDLVSLLEKMNGWTLLVVLVIFLLIIDLVKKRRPRNFPPGPQLFPLVGTFVDFKQPLHLALQKVRAPWTFLLLTIFYLFNDFCHQTCEARAASEELPI